MSDKATQLPCRDNSPDVAEAWTDHCESTSTVADEPAGQPAEGDETTGATDPAGAGEDYTGAGDDTTGAGDDTTGAGDDTTGAGHEETGAGDDGCCCQPEF